ncbi:hypothetical protein TNCV_2463121 [Trichonephila clavipes]|nr:hypothetical protein TNCV_2463121 [Trichonephila clavipes]
MTPPQGVLPKNWGVTTHNHTVTCMVFEEEFRKMTYGKADQIWSSITPMKNLTSLILSKYNELSEQATMSERMTTEPLKKSSMPHQLAHEEKTGYQGARSRFRQRASLTSELRSPTGSLKILQCNINELSTPATRTKLEQLIDIADRNGVQIVALQETKLSEHTNIKLKIFSIYRTDRPYGSGGGLAFLVRDVNYKKIPSPSTDSDLEMQGISITWKNRVINIFNFYHPPNQGHLPAEMFDCSDKNTIFLGDLNAKHQSWGCSTNNDRGNDLLNAADDGALIFLNYGLPSHTSFSYGTSEALGITHLLALNSIHIVVGTSLAALAVSTFLSSLMLRLIKKP